MNKTSKLMIQGSALLLSFVLLPGCSMPDFFKKKDEAKEQAGGVVLCRINGKAAISAADYSKNINQWAQSYLRGLDPEALPMAMKRKFFDSLVQQELILVDSDKNGIERDPEFIKLFDEQKEMIKRFLKVHLFQKRLVEGIKIDASEIEKTYSENHEKFIKVAGGILVSGIKFADDEQANAFLGKAKAQGVDFEKLAKETNATNYRDFGRINKSEQGVSLEAVPARIQEAALSAKTFPLVEKIKVGKVPWVIKIANKTDPVFLTLEEAKPLIEERLKGEKINEVSENKLKAIREANKVEINEEFFKEKTAPAQPEQKETTGVSPEAQPQGAAAAV